MILEIMFFITVSIITAYLIYFFYRLNKLAKRIQENQLYAEYWIDIISNKFISDIFKIDIEKCKSVAGAIYENDDILKYDKEKNLAYNYLVMQEVVNIMLKNQYKGKE